MNILTNTVYALLYIAASICLVPIIITAVILLNGLTVFFLPESMIYNKELIQKNGYNRFFDFKSKLYRYYVDRDYVKP